MLAAISVENALAHACVYGVNEQLQQLNETLERQVAARTEELERVTEPVDAGGGARGGPRPARG